MDGFYGCVVRKSPDAERAPAQVYAFAGGYLLIWTAFSLVATVLQYVPARTLLLSPMMESRDPIFGGALLIAAGIYQFTPFKRSCLHACRSPAEFLTRHWKNGVSGGFFAKCASRHVADVKAVITWLRQQGYHRVWLIGTSRGTQSAAYVATSLSEGGPDGLVLTSTIDFILGQASWMSNFSPRQR